MKVLGVDPGTIITGCGVVEMVSTGRLIHIFSNEIKTLPKEPLPKRLLKISNSIREIIREHRPDFCAVESPFFAKNARSALLLGHARGVIFLEAAQAGIEVFEYSPAAIKQAATGYGAADKEAVQKMIKILLNLDHAPGPDASDALAAAICHINHSKLPTVTRKDAVGTIRAI